MEQSILRFPHIPLLDNLTLVKCREVSYPIQKFIDEEKLNVNRIKVEHQNGNISLFWAAKHGNLPLYQLMMENVEFYLGILETPTTQVLI